MPERDHAAIARKAARSRARRRQARGVVPKCSDCGGPIDAPGGSLCRECRNRYMRDYRARQAKANVANGLGDLVESPVRKLSRGTESMMDADNTRAADRPEAETLMPSADMGAGSTAPRRAPTLVPVSAVEEQPEAGAIDPIETAGQLMIDRVRRLMAVAKDLGTAAAQLEMLRGSIVTGTSTAPPPEAAFKPADRFFEALDHLLGQIERRATRVKEQAAVLDRVFDLKVNQSA